MKTTNFFYCAVRKKVFAFFLLHLTSADLTSILKVDCKARQSSISIKTWLDVGNPKNPMWASSSSSSFPWPLLQKTFAVCSDRHKSLGDAREGQANRGRRKKTHSPPPPPQKKQRDPHFLFLGCKKHTKPSLSLSPFFIPPAGKRIYCSRVGKGGKMTLALQKKISNIPFFPPRIGLFSLSLSLFARNPFQGQICNANKMTHLVAVTHTHTHTHQKRERIHAAGDPKSKSESLNMVIITLLLLLLLLLLLPLPFVPEGGKKSAKLTPKGDSRVVSEERKKYFFWSVSCEIGLILGEGRERIRRE